MLNLFGAKEKFAIGYMFEDEEDTWGSIQVWVNGENLCQFKDGKQIYEHEGDLQYIPEWFCDKIEYILGYDAYPLPIKGESLLEIDNIARAYESDDFMEDDLWWGAINRWTLNHCWLSSRDGSVFPSIFFWRFDEKNMDISWDNRFWREHGVLFLSETGSIKVPYNDFKTILLEFLYTIIDDIMLRVPNKEIVYEWKKTLLFLEGKDISYY